MGHTVFCFKCTKSHVAPRKCKLFCYFLLYKAGEGVQWIKVQELKPENLSLFTDLSSERRELTFTCCHLMGYTQHYEKAPHTNNHTSSHTYARNRKIFLRDAMIIKITFRMVIIFFVQV